MLEECNYNDYQKMFEFRNELEVLNKGIDKLMKEWEELNI